MHSDEVDIDSSLVRRLLATQFPQWADLPIEGFPSTGTVNAIYRLGEDLYVRLPRVHHWAEDLERELEWLPRLSPPLPLAVPEPVARGGPDEGYPFPWAVFRWLPGEPWSRDRVRDLGEAAQDLAGFVATLRRIDPAGGPPAGRIRPLGKRDDETRAAIDALLGVVDTDAAIQAWEAALGAPAWDGVPLWTHGDLLPPNLLIDRGRLSAVLDFGAAGVGDPATDVIPAWSVFSGEAREVYRSGLGVDDGTWERGRGWALTIALLIVPYYLETNPAFAAMAKRMVEEILGDV
jgi:aminoglycoside phosphotransferase (APT) family kinase protein